MEVQRIDAGRGRFDALLREEGGKLLALSNQALLKAVDFGSGGLDVIVTGAGPESLTGYVLFPLDTAREAAPSETVR